MEKEQTETLQRRTRRSMTDHGRGGKNVEVFAFRSERAWDARDARARRRGVGRERVDEAGRTRERDKKEEERHKNRARDEKK